MILGGFMDVSGNVQCAFGIVSRIFRSFIAVSDAFRRFSMSLRKLQQNLGKIRGLFTTLKWVPD